MTPAISVVIPTHGGSSRIGPTLAALANQNLPSQDYEVVIALDGPDGGTREAIAAARPPYATRIVEQPQAGAAQARNLGASMASAPVLLFLDDDMSAGRDLLAAHLRAHERHPGSVVIGCFAQSRPDRRTDLLADGADGWWADHFEKLGRPEHRFCFRDFCTGNVSLPRTAFLETGGFSREFAGAAGEDYELGIRLLRRGARFHFATDAVSVHRHAGSLDRALERARQEGRGHVLMARLHPEVFPELPLREAVDDGPVLRGRHRVRLTPRRVAAAPVLLRPPLRLSHALKLRRPWRELHGALRVCAYWEGACEQAGSWPDLQAFVQDLPLVATARHEVEFDVAAGFDALERVLSEAPVDAMRLRHGAQPLGRLPPQAGAESLRAVHVRHALTGRLAARLLVALGPGR